MWYIFRVEYYSAVKNRGTGRDSMNGLRMGTDDDMRDQVGCIGGGGVLKKTIVEGSMSGLGKMWFKGIYKDDPSKNY